MVQWSKIWDSFRSQSFIEETRRLLPAHAQDVAPSRVPPKQVTKIALRLKYQIEQVIPYNVEESQITEANSAVITNKVIETARGAGGEEHRGCVVYCLLVCRKWFLQQSELELWNSSLHDVRAVACDVIAKRIIEEEDNQDFLLEELLMRRFSIIRNGKETDPANVIEKAVDGHALRVIGSSGYQKGIRYLWKGWIIQSDTATDTFVGWKEIDNPNYWSHFHPDRMRAPVYQYGVHFVFSLLFLVLYTIAVNTINQDGDLDLVEVILYIMTFGYICDEASKFWKVGSTYFGFWEAVHTVLYSVLTTSFVIRLVAFSRSPDENDERRRELNILGYNFFASAAPLFWTRVLMNLDSFQFFGTMFVVVKTMMRESLIFFALLVFICVGFLQSFIGFSQTNQEEHVTDFIIQAMLDAVMQSPDFGNFEAYAHPFGMILYYIFTFVVMVILLNILVALYNSAYSDITDRADDEYMALFAQKTIGYVRAPDENVFIAPFNLIELFCLVIPFEWWMDSARYERLNNFVMGVIYSPVLLVTSFLEAKEARVVRENRRSNRTDDDTVQEWEQMSERDEFGEEGWTKWTQKVQDTKPDLQNDASLNEIRELKKQLEDLKKMIQRLSPEPEGKESTT